MRRTPSASTSTSPIRLALCGCVALALLFTAPNAALAAPPSVTVSITAQVEIVSDPEGLLCANIAAGDTITGTYTYTLGTPDSNSLDYVGDYYYTAPPNGIILNLGGDLAQTDTSNTFVILELIDDYPLDGSDNYVLRSYNNYPLACGTPVEHISWQLDDPTGTALRSTHLPRRPPKLSDFQSNFGLTVQGRGEFGDWFVRAHVTSATLVR